MQEAFYLMMDPDNREAIHLKIARLLVEKMRGDNSQDLLFTIAHNFNMAVKLVSTLPPDSPDRQSMIMVYC